MNYALELVLDLTDCNPKQFTAAKIATWFLSLASELNVNMRTVCFCEHGAVSKALLIGEAAVIKEPDSTTGVGVARTGVQFVDDGFFSVHARDGDKTCNVNIFVNKQFDGNAVINQATTFFDGTIKTRLIVDRH